MNSVQPFERFLIEKQPEKDESFRLLAKKIGIYDKNVTIFFSKL